MLTMLVPALFALTTPAAAEAPASPSVWAKQTVGVGVGPKGAISDTRVQYRVPGKRSDSILFQNTYTGIGGRFQLSPAFVDIGPRLSLAPIDIFDVDVQGSWTGYAGPFAPLSMSGLSGRIESARQAREGENMAMHKVELSVSPTVKLKLGPVIAFNSTTIGALHAWRPEAGAEDPFWYEPYRDMVVAYDDVTVENQAAAVYEVLDGKGKSKLWLGATTRHRQAMVSKDAYTTVGGIAVFRPGDGSDVRVPTFIAQGLAFTSDVERVGTMPTINVAATWTLDRPLGLREAMGH